MAPPTSRKEVRTFMGAINYYRDMWPRRSHTLATLTKLRSTNRKFEWTEVEQYYFDKIKRILDRNNLLTYQDFNETFTIHTDASALQL